MGKCVRIRGSGKQNPSTGEAAACLTLRSGRRVPVAASCRCSTPGSRRHRRVGAGAAAACGRCGSPGRRKSAEPRPHRGRTAALESAELSGGRPEEEELPSQASLLVARNVEARGDSFERPNTNLGAGEVEKPKHENGSKGGVAAGPPSPSPAQPLLQAEMEAFFAAAELAERRRFAES